MDSTSMNEPDIEIFKSKVIVILSKELNITKHLI